MKKLKEHSIGQIIGFTSDAGVLVLKVRMENYKEPTEMLQIVHLIPDTVAASHDREAALKDAVISLAKHSAPRWELMDAIRALEAAQ